MIGPAIWAVIRRVEAPRGPLLLRSLDGRLLAVPAEAAGSARRLNMTAGERRMSTTSRRQRSPVRGIEP